MMDIGEKYGLSDLRHLISSEAFPTHRSLPPPQQPHYGFFLIPSAASAADQVEEVVLSPPPNPVSESPPHLPPPPPPSQPLCQLPHDGTDFFPGFSEEGRQGGRGAVDAAAAAAAAAAGGGSIGEGGGGYSHGRWPRQETLTLLEIRSRLDPKFKEAAQKAPLWDEVSRMMAEEHGYQRSGKKCREKLENLYKYYKKTKEGKAGRNDGQHYRFFRQLEALYGEGSSSNQSNNNPVASDYPSLQMLTHPCSEQEAPQAPLKNLTFSSNSSDLFDSSCSSEEEEEEEEGGGGVEVSRGVKRGRRRRRSWKAKVREFVDGQMKRFMAVQEAWLEKMLATLEHKERERMCREEEWRQQEADRFDREHQFWAKERAWIEARDAALIQALDKLGDTTPSMDAAGEDSCDNPNDIGPCEALDGGGGANNKRWPEAEVTCLSQLMRTPPMEEASFQEGGFDGSTISAGMGSASWSKEQWENVNKSFSWKTTTMTTKRCNNNNNKKKRKKKKYSEHLDSLGVDHCCRENSDCGEDAAAVAEDVPSPSHSIVDACGDHPWELFPVLN